KSTSAAKTGYMEQQLINESHSHCVLWTIAYTKTPRETGTESEILTNFARIPSDPFIISLLATISTAVKRGVMPAGQKSRARSALLPDAIISATLSQLAVIFSYTPLMCTNVRFGLTGQNEHGYSIRDAKRFEAEIR
ncbi:hypothetical protein KIN20_034798, partial [Parelaphostrongylus tenuis]